jgi:hypothetical protein
MMAKWEINELGLEKLCTRKKHQPFGQNAKKEMKFKT